MTSISVKTPDTVHGFRPETAKFDFGGKEYLAKEHCKGSRMAQISG